MYKKKRILFFLSIWLILSLTLNPEISRAVDSTDDSVNKSQWLKAEVSGFIAEDTYDNYKILLKPENFQLLGKLMTLFLSEKGKAYKIEKAGHVNRFSIQSGNTIQPGSYLDINSMDNSGFSMSGDLKIKKILSFDCDFKLRVDYQELGNEISYQALVRYDAPVIVSGFNSIYSVFVGEDFITLKIFAFIDNIHLVLNELTHLDKESWHKITNDQELPFVPVFPLSFTSREIALIENLLDS